jgi:molybdopterin molybdotransferase
MDHCAQPELLSFEEALAKILDQVAPIENTEIVSISSSLDRVLGETVYAPINVPGADNSAMDGYAIRLADNNREFRVIGEAFAGHVFPGKINSGEAVRIMTGGIIPEGANSVVMQENTVRTNDRITISKIPLPDENIRRAGEDITKDSLVLAKGTRLNALHIGLLASLGIATVNLFRKIRVAILSTGDELLQPGELNQPGKIYDSNRFMLAALLERLNIELIDYGCIKDDPVKLQYIFLQAADQADLIISSGGVSVGEADFTKDVLLKSGNVSFYKIAMKPGKPLAFGKLKSAWFFGLPGNPVSSAVTYHQLVVPGLRRLAGEMFSSPTHYSATAAQSLKKQPGRKDFQRGILSWNESGFVVASAGSQSSGVLSGLAKANAYICLEKERGNIKEGENVTVIPFDTFIR